ncbi:DUF5071 domain-containing protein [Pseudaminobacter sp. 19-2017]|uniref:DUF5071 domain-containing protein n=1 Tax=Pseudaminobacter soli (ex Zhang et al. 2022) TaxID=2831468 RepID=A0A942DWZ9_9HYPH|nr:DUF5071 domain-containing protein [Pseudaminobacter soli]
MEPVLPQILQWMQDMNWPVAMLFESLVTSIGPPLAPHLRDIFLTDDDVWKYWMLKVVVGDCPALVTMLRPEITQLSQQSSPYQAESRDAAPEILQLYPE